MKFTTTGHDVYQRTYSRPKPDGSYEEWAETVERVVDGNLGLVDPKFVGAGERQALINMMTNFEILPAGRHLWASGVPGRQFLYNCHVAPWSDGLADHVEFVFMRLMEGGGVGSRYGVDCQPTEPVARELNLHLVCAPDHADYLSMVEAGHVSMEYGYEWPGAFKVEDSREGWAAALVDLVDTYLRPEVKNANRVYDLSGVRPSGAPLRTFGGTASGPLPLAKMLREVARIMNAAGMFRRPISGVEAMEIDHFVAECVVSGGNRRSARMAMMHWTDPEILSFINSKKHGGHWTTNISVIIDNEFIQTLQAIYEPDSDARRVFDAAVTGMYLNGEPGLWNEELSNQDEPNTVVATNPCGEQPLPEMGACVLGHVNLAAFPDWHDEDQLFEAHRLMTRFLIRATYGDITYPKQKKIMERDRRIGLGHLGVQWFANLRGIRFSTIPTDYEFADILGELYEFVKAHAQDYARELRIPVPVKLTTIAPTGSISKMPGVSEGLHTIYSRYFNRRIRFSSTDPKQKAKLEQYEADGYHVEDCVYAPFTKVVTIPTKDGLMEAVDAAGFSADDIVESADDLTVKQMLDVQAFYQQNFVDSAISFTVNFDPKKVSREELAEALLDQLPYIKGTTVLPEGSYAQAPYERITKEEFEAAELTETGDAIDMECSTGACPIK
ncbi:ribonucleoside-triphosphate reductase, adenosylcobalamin-dependent [Streptomyces sp. NPDC004732]|uniref:ribonucleoside-triphosphate reductase, adenosylcobalamin-dependent n=1 Tax=Streptomyces sp. NPDC004732 TaxID=3154290 RepID=UPI0033BB81C3